MIKLKIPVLFIKSRKWPIHPRYIFTIPGYEMIGDESWDDDPEYIYFVFQEVVA